MKKVVSLLVALTVVLSLSVTAFAAEDDIDGVFGSRALLSDRNTRVSYGGSGDIISLDQYQLVIVENKNTNAIVMPESELEPGTEYEFKIFYSDTNYTNEDVGKVTLKELKHSELGGAKLRLRGMKGTSVISSAKINRKGSGSNSTYRLVINTKENWGTKQTDVEYQLSITGTQDASGIPFETSDLTFQVGYGRYSDDEIDNFGEGDIVTIDNDYPVILKEQFTELAKTNNYKAVQFEAEDGMWSYLGRVSGMKDSNFKYTRDVIPAIVEKFEDQEFEFLTFGAGVTFPTNGEMRIDVSDFSDEFDSMYTYLYRNGKLTPINTTYDSGADEIVFRTNYLGSFVITDQQITDTTIIDMGNDNENEGDDNEAEEVPGEGGNQNPDTGASSTVNMAAILGLASLAAAATVIRKK